MPSNLVQIPISFSYESTVYVSSSSVAFSPVQESMILPAAGVNVTVTDRTTGNPATVYANSTGTATYTSVTTDAAGNVPGWVVQGSYAIAAAAAPPFSGATINWEAVPGAAVGNIATGAVDTGQIASNAVTAAKLADGAVGTQQLANGSVNGSKLAAGLSFAPTGSIFDYAGSTAPSGYHFTDGSVQSQTDPVFSALYAVVGSIYNTGGEGAGNFRLPNTQGRFILGKTTSGTGATLGGFGGSLNHTHNVPSLVVNNHNHNLSTNAGVQLWLARSGGGTLYFIWGDYGPSSWSDVSDGQVGNVSPMPPIGVSPNPQSGFGLYGHTDLATSTTQGGVDSGSANPAFLVLNKIIKL